MDKSSIKKEELKRTKGRKGLFTKNGITLVGKEVSEVRQIIVDANNETDPFYLAERYEKAAISYIESLGYEYQISAQKSIKLSKEEREKRLEARNQLIREKLVLNGEVKPLTIENIENEDVVCWWNYLKKESEKQGKHGIGYALDVIEIVTQIKNNLNKDDDHRLFNLAMRLTNNFSIMVVAQYEDKICAGMSRTLAGSKAKEKLAERKKECAIKMAKNYQKQKSSNPHRKLTNYELYQHVTDELNKKFTKESGRKEIHIDTVRKRYLKDFFRKK